MGLQAKLKSFIRKTGYSESQIDPGGGYIKTSEHFSDPGDDSSPLADDHVATSSNQATGGQSVVGYIDPQNEQKAQPGDKRIYGRTSDGVEASQVWLMNDGIILISNEVGVFTVAPGGAISGVNNNGRFELQDDGIFKVNGVEIDKNGNISSPGKIDAQEMAALTSLKVATIEVLAHHHNIILPVAATPVTPML